MTLTTNCDERYFEWLCAMVGVRPTGTASDILMTLHKLPFTPEVDRDENRFEDGQSLRRAFTFETDVRYIPDCWYNEECSFLEMVVALSERMGLHIDADTPTTFWHLMRNLGLSKTSEVSAEEIYMIVKTVNDRTFDRDGYGGLFPLRVATRDQRDIELYAQMQDYIMELDL